MIDLLNDNILRGIKRQSNDEYSAFCPVCEPDKSNGTHNLYFKYDSDKWLLNCKKGCSIDSICAVLNIDTKDLFADPQSKNQQWQFIREHIYKNESGDIIGKKEILLTPDGKKTGIWYRYENGNAIKMAMYIKGLDRLKMPLYHLPELIDTTSDTVYFVEGEKDVETMERMGFTATTTPNGAGQAKIPDDCIKYFNGKNVIILHDNDESGLKYAEVIQNTLRKKCKSVVIVDPVSIYPELANKGDISDIVQAIGEDETITRLKYFTVDINTLSTWEEISDTDLLMNVCMNCSDIGKTDKLSALRDKAKKIQKFKDLNEKIKAVESECTRIKRERHRHSGNTGVQLDDSPILLDVGDYTVNRKGVFLYDSCIIPQPLLITKRFEDIENGTVRLELAFHDKKRWKYITIDKSVTANKNKIVELANQGLLITSETSIGVVKYLQDLQMLNDIPTQSTVSHLGFVGKQFVPYASPSEDGVGIIYTGTDFEEVYRSVHSKGNLDEWVKLYRDVRNDNIAVRAAVASSFASPLIHVFGKLPFFTHIRGDSDTGKTMTLRVAASVWGYHDGYMLNMNSTNVGAELTAYFLHNLPYILDELQTAKADKVGEFVYKTSQGRGRQRGMANGGVAPVRDWKCCMITNGEQPLTSQNSHTGEINRIIDIPVTGQIFKNPSDVYAVCDEHYGVAGRYFIEHLNEYKPREILDKWETRLNQLNTDISGKHRMALSLILTADELCNRMLFDFDENKAEVDTIEFYQRLSKMIVSTAESDLTTRAYDFICNWLGENYRNFHKTGEQVSPVQYWGRYSEGKTSVLISGNALREALEKNSFNYDAVLKGLADRNLLINNTGNKKNIKQFFINGVRFSGIELTLSTPSTLYLP